MALFWVRAGFVLLLVACFAATAKYPTWVKRRVERFFLSPVPAFNLGLLRIIVFGHLLRGALNAEPAWYAGLPKQLLTLPRGWDWLEYWVPPDPSIVEALHQVSIVACGLAIVGLFSRVACPVAAASILLVLGLPNFYLKIGHAYHLAELCAILLSFAPSGSGLSVDQLLRRLRGAEPPAPSLQFNVPIRLAMVLLGTTYFFPGFWKLWECGDLWISGDKLRAEMLTKWAELPDYVPALRLVDLPLLCALLGTWTLIFELGFLPALLHPATRHLAVINAMVFHLGISLTMGITFPLYLPLIASLTIGEQTEDWTPSFSWTARLRAFLSRDINRTLEQWRRHVPSRLVTTFSQPKRQASAAVWLVGSGLAIAMFVAGATPFDSWPVGVYPRFSTRALDVPTHGNLLEFELARSDGNINLGSQLGRFEAVRSSILARTILAAKKDPQAMRQRLGPIVSAVYHGWSEPRPGDILSIYQKTWVTDPRERGTFERSLLFRLQL